MPNGPGEPVDHGLLVFVDMTVGMGDSVGVEIGMIVLMLMGMFVLVEFVQVRSPPSDNPVIIPRKGMGRKPHGGIFSEK